MTILTLNGNALHLPLPDKSAQCCITSPPYWGLRDYGTAKWEGGNSECEHRAPRGDETAGPKQQTNIGAVGRYYKDICAKCGAIRIDAQIGLESTPDEYVANIVAAMREVWRVLRDDGVLFLNLGDSYASGEIGRHDGRVEGSGYGARHPGPRQQTKLTTGLKPKDLVGIPWLVAFALRADGWYLRSEIIWHKPNPMPESVTDRPTKAHEQVFLLAKQEHYFYDGEAIKEPIQESSIERAKYGWNGKMIFEDDGTERRSQPDPIDKMGDRWSPPNGRNKRTVWTIATSPFSGAHFATFPPALVEPMVLVGSRRGDLVIDPFAGTSTVGRVCAKHGRSFIGTELNPAYIELAQERTSGVQIAMSAVC